MAKIVLFGAGGMLGRRILGEALERGHQVSVVVRDPDRAPHLPVAVAVLVGNVLDPAGVASVALGSDVLVSAVGGGLDGAANRELLEPAARSLVAGLRTLGDKAPRLIVVGGAGGLETPTGGQVWDAPGIPEPVLHIMRAHGEALDYLRTVRDIRWTSLSPAASIAPGERTGSYRTGTDNLVTDELGRSRITAEDYAVALVDEIEHPQHIRARFTVGH